jgi:peroxiredoxin
MRWLLRRVLLLLGGTATLSAAGPKAPASGVDLVGSAARPWQLREWDGSEPLRLEELKGRVVVLRFWTNTCPYCARSLPALQALAHTLRGRDVVFIGVYHSKPRGTERPWADAVRTARGWGVTFPLAYDREWKTLESWWLSGREPVPTSATFVIDRAGAIAHVHPGPELHPSEEPEHGDCDRDFASLKEAVEKVLNARQ